MGNANGWQAIAPCHGVFSGLETGARALGLTLMLLAVLARIALALFWLPAPPPARSYRLVVNLTPVPTQPLTQALTPAASAPTPRPTATPRPTPTPGPLRVAIERSVYDRYRSYFRKLAGQQGRLTLLPYADRVRVHDTLAAGRADLAIYWATRRPRTAILLRVEPYAVTVHPLSSSGGFTLAQLADLARGQDQEYKLVVGDGGAAARDLLGLDQLGAETILADDWTLAKEYVARHEGTIALLPWEQVDFRVRVAPVEGHRLDPRHLGKYPLVRRLWLASEGPVPKPLAEDLRSALHYEPPPIVELVAVGDIVLDGQVKELMQQEGSRYAFEAEGVRDLLSQADIAYGNLESSSSLESSAPRGTEGSEVRSESWIDPQAVAALTYAGFDLVSLAHSQTDPHADLAVTDTLRLLSEADIAPVGAGGTITEAQEALVIEADGLRVAFLAHSQSGPSRDGPISGGSVPGPEHLIARVRAARMTADLVVVSCRWGAGYAPHPSASQKGLAQSLAQAGAALIIGHHPHVVQGLHYHDDTFTAYGLGNFVYDQSLSHQTSEGLILRCLLDASGVKTVELLPICIYRCQPSFVSPEGSRSFLQRVMQVTQGEDALPR